MCKLECIIKIKMILKQYQAEAHQIYGMHGIHDEHIEGHTNRFLSQCHVLKEQDSDKMLNTCTKELTSKYL